ncbi:hypothetical protein [Hymenobacter crusticola]|uniref:Uncharacterized protein n=1 Tax=Hymenobacter crusticola TaxID=1770526 RepID=A0A243W6P7_9BACT|nr:hypothetical protein [Hymenobacter crusticola]OUJ70036.1 hypothetical protein BXP70_25530 [Hymenobacter crusticola]
MNSLLTSGTGLVGTRLSAVLTKAGHQLQQHEAYRRFFERELPTEEGTEPDISHYYVLSKQGATYWFYPYATLPRSLQEQLRALFDAIFQPENRP